MGAIDSVAADPIEAARASQVTLLAVPIYATLDFMEKLSGVLGSRAPGDGRGQHQARDYRGRQRGFTTRRSARRFFPGHPMAGKERGGAALGDANLFRGAVWLFTDDCSGERSPQSAELVKEWREWVAAMGSKTLDLDAARHDELVAWVSHLPQFTATALSALLEDEVGDAPELKDVGGRALREMTRLGASPFSMWRDIAHTNTEADRARALRLSNSASRTCEKTCERPSCVTNSNRRTSSGGNRRRTDAPRRARSQDRFNFAAQPASPSSTASGAGHWWAMAQSRNASKMWPLQRQWRGPTRRAHPRCPPLLQCESARL